MNEPTNSPELIAFLRKERDEALKAARDAATHAADAVAHARQMERERVDYAECRADNTRLGAQLTTMRSALEGTCVRTLDDGTPCWCQSAQDRKRTVDEPHDDELCVECRAAFTNTNPVLDALAKVQTALEAFKDLGRPRPPSLLAYHDLDAAVVVYSNSGVYITAGDVRRLQEALEAVHALNLGMVQLNLLVRS